MICASLCNPWRSSKICLSRSKRSTEGGGARLAALMDLTLTSMTAMLDSMLDVNRIETGIVRPDMRAVELAPVIQKVAEEFRTACDVKGLKLRIVPCTAWVRTDPQLLTQMLRNLLSNALKYTPKGGILVGCRRRDGNISVVVCDTGIGVAASETAQIFDAYHQGKKANAMAGPGAWSGAVDRQATSRVDGASDLCCCRPLAKGSSFMITVPIVDPAPKATDTLKNAAALAEAVREKGRILMVEDEEPLRGLLAEVLEKEGHEVIAMSDCEERAGMGQRRCRRARSLC